MFCLNSKRSQIRSALYKSIRFIVPLQQTADMFSSKVKVLLFFVLNISVTMGLRFFKTRKRKKNCLVGEGWNAHNVTCVSKYQICCETGCCDNEHNSAVTTYVRVGIVCAVISSIFMFVYIEIWCKKKCKLFRNFLKSKCSCSMKNTSSSSAEILRRQDPLENCQEMQILYISNEKKSDKQEATNGKNDDQDCNSSLCSSKSDVTFKCQDKT